MNFYQEATLCTVQDYIMFAVNKHLYLNLSSSSLMCKKRFLSMCENVREKRSKIELSYQASIWLPKEVDKITKTKEGECLVLICLIVIIKCNWSAGLSWLIRCYNHSWRFLDKTNLIYRAQFIYKISPLIITLFYNSHYGKKYHWKSPYLLFPFP